MRNVYLAAILAASISIPITAKTPSRHTAHAGGQCAGLQSQYKADVDRASRYMAFSDAMADASERSSAQTTAQTKQANTLSKVNIDLNVLKGAGCPVPPVTPDPEPYKPAARGCARQMILSHYDDGLPQGCDPETWTK
ncbi:hypothetical protein [Sphingomonas sp.]|uniref:hypothetical protein n=1 Tax=Sphingomonas sp. TaxID=28214 RepID=UPI003AFFCE1C